MFPFRKVRQLFHSVHPKLMNGFGKDIVWRLFSHSDSSWQYVLSASSLFVSHLVLQEPQATQRRLEVVRAAMDGAFAALETKERMVRYLEVGTTYLSFLVGLGKSAAEVRLSQPDRGSLSEHAL